MAIPPSPGHYVKSDFQAKIEEAQNALTWLANQFAALKDGEVVEAKKLEENAAKAKAEAGTHAASGKK